VQFFGRHNEDAPRIANPMSDTPVTAWLRWNEKDKKYEFNHLEDGRADGLDPTGTNPSWKNGKWFKVYGYLTSGAAPQSSATLKLVSGLSLTAFVQARTEEELRTRAVPADSSRNTEQAARAAIRNKSP
jgi:hypothetical protein